jgi:predicted dehydrogenase
MNRKQFLQSMGGAGAVAAAPTSGVAAAAQAPSEKRIGVGLIGCGTRGTALGAALGLLGTQGEAAGMVAVSDIYQPRLERAATRYSARYYKDYRELVRDPEVNAVIVATPDRVHVYAALEAIRAGKDVYCEKPVAHWQQFDKLKELVKEARAHKTVFQMGSQRLADPMWRHAEAHIRSGGIGKPVHVQMGYFRLGDGGERGMPIEDPNAQPGPSLDWEAFQADAPPRPFSITRFFQWRLYMDYSGGPVTDNNIHFIALMVKALGVGMPSAVASLGGRYQFGGERDVPDTFDTIFQYPGLNFTFMGTYSNDTGTDTLIRGTEGTIKLEEFGMTSQPLTTSRKGRRDMTRQDMTADHMRDFLRCVRTREKTQGDIELAYAVNTAVIMAMRSYNEGKVARFDPETETIRT